MRECDYFDLSIGLLIGVLATALLPSLLAFTEAGGSFVPITYVIDEIPITYFVI